MKLNTVILGIVILIATATVSCSTATVTKVALTAAAGVVSPLKIGFTSEGVGDISYETGSDKFRFSYNLEGSIHAYARWNSIDIQRFCVGATCPGGDSGSLALKPGDYYFSILYGSGSADEWIEFVRISADEYYGRTSDPDQSPKGTRKTSLVPGKDVEAMEEWSSGKIPLPKAHEVDMVMEAK